MRFVKWAIYAAFCIASWVLALVYIVIAGGVSCKQAGNCPTESVMFIGIMLLIPAEITFGAWMRFKERG